MSENGDTRGLVLEIQRMSTEDGPGLRTTLFLKGCSLACLWCHNPESISRRPQLRWIENRCIGCLECIDICTAQALSKGAEGIIIARNACTGCGACADHCPSGALELWGRTMTAAEALKELVKDRAYFGSDGGVTVSGGEATLQAPFVHELFKGLTEEGIHTALDTCGVCTMDQLETSCEYADLILFDIKEIDPERHRRYTGGPFEHVVRSFLRVVELVETSRLHGQAWKDHRAKELWVRTPVIPGMTDRFDNIAGIARFLAEYAGSIDRWELCAFNNLCRDKYRRLGRTWELEGAPLMPSLYMDELVETAVEAGFPRDRVRWSGMVRHTGE